MPVRPGNQQDVGLDEHHANSDREFIDKVDEKSFEKVTAFDPDDGLKNKPAPDGVKKQKSALRRMDSTFGLTMDELDRKHAGLFYMHGEKEAFRMSKMSLFCLSDTNVLRKLFVWVATWKWFDYFITLAIILNSFMLASTDY